MRSLFNKLVEFADDPKRFAFDHFGASMGVSALIVGAAAATVTGFGFPAFVAGAVLGAIGTDVVMSGLGLVAAVPAAMYEKVERLLPERHEAGGTLAGRSMAQLFARTRRRGAGIQAFCLTVN